MDHAPSQITLNWPCEDDYGDGTSKTLPYSILNLVRDGYKENNACANFQLIHFSMKLSRDDISVPLNLNLCYVTKLNSTSSFSVPSIGLA